MKEFNKQTSSKSFMYVFDSNGEYIMTFPFKRQIPIGVANGGRPLSGNIWEEFPLNDILGPNNPEFEGLNYRLVQDPISIQTLYAWHLFRDPEDPVEILMQKERSVQNIEPYFNTDLQEVRAEPVIEIQPTSDNYNGSQHFQTDLHHWIQTKHIFSIDNQTPKTKIDILVMDPVTEKKLDYDCRLTVKIQKLFDSFPELYLKEDISIENGIFKFSFDTPQESCNMFFKVKPTKQLFEPTKQVFLDPENDINDIKELSDRKIASAGLHVKQLTTAFAFRK